MTSRFPVAAPDFSSWKQGIKCQAACPVHTDVAGYVRAIANGQDELAYLIARGPNPLASICGRICGAPCETACRRGELDQPVSIRALKRFACERYGPGSGAHVDSALIDFLMNAALGYSRDCQDTDEFLPLMQGLMAGVIPRATGFSVGIVGSGPAGLAAAHDLALLGCVVTIYESESTLAGMLSVGVPEYRLPRDLIRAEVEVILSLGVHAVTNCTVGRDIAFSQLRDRHDAVIVAVGLKQSRRLAIPGADATGVLGGVEFLRDVALGRPPKLGEKVIVIGGGNVAYDVGRTVLRQIAIDAARTAIRDEQVAKVYLCSLESLEEMPADLIEIREGDEEGILRRNGWGPVEILKDERGGCRGVVFRRCMRVYDESRRFAPQFDDSIRETIECSTVLLSVGQAANLAFIGEGDGLQRRADGTIACDPETGRTSVSDVFVAGDLAHGPKLLIHAVASGKRVARSVYESLTGNAIEFSDTELRFPIAGFSRAPAYETTPRTATRTRPVEERLKSHAADVEIGLSEAEARREASRCLDCGVNTVFDGGKCIACGGCVDVCPQACLYLVSAERLAPGSADAGARDPISPLPPDGAPLAIIKDETICIRCGLCAARCPVSAVMMERFRFAHEPMLAPR